MKYVLGLMEILLSFTFLLSLYILWNFHAKCQLLRGFKGPTPIPILGNCYSPQALMFMKYMYTLLKQYGSVFTFFALSQPYLVVCDPFLARQILSDSKLFVKGDIYTKYFSLVFGESLVTSNGEKHRVDRAMFAKYFHKNNILKFATRINEITLESVDDLFNICLVNINQSKTSIQTNGTNNKHSKLNDHRSKTAMAYNLETFFAKLALRVFTNFAYSESFSEEDEETLCHNISRGSFLVGRVVGLGLPVWNIFPQIRELRYLKSTEWKFIEPLYERRKAELARGEKKDVNDLLSLMISSQMSRKTMCDHIATLTSAGHDTTAYFSSYLCYLLATHPVIQEKVKDEILSTFGPYSDGNTENSNMDLTPEKLFDLKYLQKVMKETLRLYAVIPIVSKVAAKDVYLESPNNNRSASNNNSINNINNKNKTTTTPTTSSPAPPLLIRQGTQILIPLFLLNREVEIWGADASEFNPDRFDRHCQEQYQQERKEKNGNSSGGGNVMSPSIAGVSDKDVKTAGVSSSSSSTSSLSSSSSSSGGDFTSAKHGYFPFGYGSRMCIGSTLAQIETSIFLCHLLRRFRLLPEPNFKPTIMAGISLTTSNGIRVLLEPIIANPSATDNVNFNVSQSVTTASDVSM